MKFIVKYLDKEISFSDAIKVSDIVGKDLDIICAKVNGRVRELSYVINKDSTIVPLTCKDRDAKFIYESSLRFVIAMILYRYFPKVKYFFSYNISRCIYLKLVNQDDNERKLIFDTINKELSNIVKQDFVLVRKKVLKQEALELFKEFKYDDKIQILKYRPEKTAHYYKCDGYINYMYSRMVPSTAYLKQYNLIPYNEGILIQYPRPDYNGQIPPFEDSPIHHQTLERARKQAEITDVHTVVGINNKIENGKEIELINLAEASHARQFAEIGDLIIKSQNRIKIVCIAGPSSSGKTTFANKLKIELLSRGLKPIRISLDDYYLPIESLPVDEKGNKDFESINALDIPLFNKEMGDLLSMKETKLTILDFKTRTRKFSEPIKIDETNIIIIEGIHALNDEMTKNIPSEQKFKIFISPQTQINIDCDNPLTLTDLRLLRRIVRDNQFRNTTAVETISMWESVRRGEFKWIYKTEDNADYVFNSFLPYELCALKKYALPLLNNINVDSEYFPISERLIRMLKFFVDVDDKWIPCNSLIREFIGGSCFQD